MQAHGKVLHAINDPAVDRQESVGAQQALIVIYCGDHRLDRDLMIGRDDLAAVNPFVLFVQCNGFASRIRGSAPAFGGNEFQQLQKRFQPQ